MGRGKVNGRSDVSQFGNAPLRARGKGTFGKSSIKRKEGTSQSGLSAQEVLYGQLSPRNIKEARKHRASLEVPLPDETIRPKRASESYYILLGLNALLQKDSLTEVAEHVLTNLKEAMPDAFLSYEEIEQRKSEGKEVPLGEYTVVLDYKRVAEAFEELQSNDPQLHDWKFEASKWDAILRGLEHLHSYDYSREDKRNIEAIYQRLCSGEIAQRQGRVHCGDCGKLLHYSELAGTKYQSYRCNPCIYF